MPSPDIGLLGLPTSFSADDPALRAEQYQHAISVGFDKFDRRFRNLTARRWRPTPSSLKIYEEQAAFIEAMLSRDPLMVQHPNRSNDMETALRELPPKAWSDYDREEILFNMDQIKTPLQLAVVTAHESGHLTGKPHPLRFRSRAAILEAGDMRESIENAALESLMDYAALEVTGLLLPPITRLIGDPELLKEAARYSTLKQFASAFGNGFMDKVFRMTQGTLSDKAASELDTKMGYHPVMGWDSYHDRGIIFPAAVIQNPHWEEGTPLTTRTSTQVAAWFRRVNGQNLEFMQRPDVMEATLMAMNIQRDQTA